MPAEVLDVSTVTYCTTEDVTNYYRGRFRKISSVNDYVALQAVSGSGQTNEDRVNLTAANAGLFYDQDRVRVFDDNNTVGELGTIESITFNGNSSYLDLENDLDNTYNPSANAAVQLRSYFNRSSNPDVATVHRMINDAEDEIDRRTHDSWRATTVTDEYHDRPTWRASVWPGLQINLHHQNVRTLTSGTDKLEVYEGAAGTWTDYVANKTAGRGNDYWVDYTNGIIYLPAWFIWHQKSAVRVTYRYGKSTVPNDIRKCAAMMVARDLLINDQHTGNVKAEESPSVMGISGRVNDLERRIDRIIEEHKRLIVGHM